MIVAVVVALVALLLPVRLTAGWLEGSAMPSDALMAGVWTLKVALGATAVALGWLSRVGWSREAAGRTPVPEASVPSTGLQGGLTAISPGTLALILVVVGAALRLYGIGTELWHDEIDTITRYAPLSLRELLTTYQSQNQHPLYLLLAKIAYDAVGAEWAVRLPAVAFGVGSLWAAYVFARRYASIAEALLCVLFLTVSYHHVWFSQNARGYSAMLFFTLLGTIAFMRLAQEDERHPVRMAVLYAVCMALAAYTHLTSVLIAVGHGVAWLLSTPWRGSTRVRGGWWWPGAALVLAAIVTIDLYALILPQVLSEVLRPTLAGVEVEWTSPWWLLGETVRVLGEGVPGGPLIVVAALVVLAIGVVSYARQSRLLVLLMFCPVVVTGVTLVAMRHNLWPRFFFFAAAFVVLAALRGGFVLVRAVLGARGHAVATGLAAVVAGLSVVILPRAWLPKQQYLAAARFVEEQRQPGDQVVALGLAAAIYRTRGIGSDWRLDPPRDTLLALEHSSRRLWVVYTFAVHLEAVHPDLAERVGQPPYREVRVFPATVGGGELRVLLNDSAPIP